MHVVIMTPMERLLESSDITKLRVMLDDGGWLSIYEKHAPIIAAVAPCEVQLEDGDGLSSRLAIDEGVLNLRDGKVTIYVNQTPTSDGADPIDMELETIDRLSGQLMQLLEQRVQGDQEAG